MRVLLVLTTFSLISGCNSGEQQYNERLLPSPQIGSCFYKADFINIEDDTPLRSSQMVSISNLFSEDGFVVSVVSGNSFDGRMFFELRQPCDSQYDELVRVISEINNNSDDVDFKYRVYQFTKSNWFEMNMGHPDIQNDFGAKKSYYEPVYGSCFYKIDAVNEQSGYPIEYSGDLISSIYDSVESEALERVLPDNFVKGRSHIKLSEPCDKSLEQLNNDLSTRLLSMDKPNGQKYKIVRFAKSTKNEFEKVELQ